MRTIAVAGLCCLLSGCYYVQATRGQMEVLSKRQPIDEIIASPDTDAELGRRLRLVQEARRFSVEQLGLPDNKSYRTYSDLERDYVVWNVFAAPEFALGAREWCYPIVGCVSYRGYFSEEAAQREAGKLRDEGFDVAVGGVPAYSTLGNFNDPVLNTMMRWGGAFGRPAKYWKVVSSGATIPARAPASMLILHSVIRASMFKDRTAEPAYSST